MDLHRPSGILAAPPLAGVSVKPPFSPHPRASPERRPAALPAALAFLTVHGVSPAVLLTAAVEARRQAIAPEAAALANRTIRERFFYRCLAHHLGAAFIDGKIALGAGARYPHAIHAGLAPLDGGDGSRWLAAPRGQLLTHLLARARGGAWARALRSRRLRICRAWWARRRPRRSSARQASASPTSIRVFPRKNALAARSALPSWRSPPPPPWHSA
jgi:hypothetical protein